MNQPAFADAPPALRKGALGAMGLLFVLGTLGAAFSPWLLVNSPLGLILLAPDNRHLVLVAPALPWTTFVGVTILRRGLALTVTYVLAGIYGPAALAWAQQRSPRTAGVVSTLERWFDRMGPALLLIAPTYTVSALAGVAGTRLGVFLAATTVGQVLFLSMLYGFGEGLSGVIQPFVGWVSDNLWETTAVCVAAVALWQGLSWVRRRRGPGLPPLTE